MGTMRSNQVLWAMTTAVATVAVGFLTNLVTSGSPSPLVIAGFILALLASVVMAGCAAALGVQQKRTELRAARAAVLRPFVGGGDDASGHTVVSLLDPLAGFSPFVGHTAEMAELLSWCTTPGSSRVRLLDGPGGVG
jgi:hypothetical protein